VGYLNRQFIVIMAALGIPEGTFIQLFDAAVNDIRGLPARVAEGIATRKDIKTAQSLAVVSSGRSRNRNRTVDHRLRPCDSSL
jgi:hypothetical protein